MYLIVGLGNPGAKYEVSRHNAGFRVIDLWSRELGVKLKQHRFQARIAQTIFQEKKILLFCPVTFMNLSGMAVRACRDYFDLETEDILVLHDDLDLPVGRIKLARSGSSGGHKGILSIIKHLGSSNFPRIKIGIGRPRYGEDVEDFVLSPFYKDERDTMEDMFHLAVHGCELFLSEGIDSAMNQVNYKNLTNKEETN